MTGEVHLGKLRLDKIIADTGRASRKEATQLIKNGSVTVDGRIAASGSDKYDPDFSVIVVAGQRLVYSSRHYFMMNKPSGYVSATEDSREKTVQDLLQGDAAHLGLFPAGRLDKDAEGLLILTDDGDYVHRIISPSKHVWKAYYVRTTGVLELEDVSAFAAGITLKDGLECLPAELSILTTGDESTAIVKVREGKYHQVKRMLASRGKPVTYLKRIAIGGLLLDEGLAPASYRAMTSAEVAAVFE